MDALVQQAIELAKQGGASFIPIAGKIVYVLNHGQSSAISSYDVDRTQGIAQALSAQGVEALCLTREGSPLSLEAAVEQLEQVFRGARPAKVLADASALVGLPAWVVAKRLNLPFYVEVRGFPELVRDALKPGYANTLEFKVGVERDTFVAKRAEKVFTLSQAMKNELIQRGVDSERIELLPNGLNELPVIKPADPELKATLGIGVGDKVVGYVGGFSPLEDLEVLVEACDELTMQGEHIKLLLIGDDRPVTRVLNDPLEVGAKSWLIQVGKVSDDQLANYYGLIDAVVIPRKPLAVCELVPPMRVLEALAYGKRLVVSNVAALSEYTNEHESIFEFRAGSAADLARGIKKAFESCGAFDSGGLLIEKGVEKLSELFKFNAGEAGLTIQQMRLAAGWSNCQKIFDAEDAYRGKNTQEVINYILDHSSTKADGAAELTRLARLSLPESHEVAVQLALSAVRLDPKPFRIKWLGFLLFDAGQVIASNNVLSSLPAKITTNAKEIAKINYIKGCAKLLLCPPVLTTESSQALYVPIEKKALYVAASSRPYLFNGYTSRTHGVLKGLMENGWDVLCVTRPGFPEDRSDRAGGAEICYDVRELDGVRYQALKGAHRRNVPLYDYLYKSAAIIFEKAKEERVSVIHAASNYEAAFPALIAAKELGIKFIYEVRGLWEYTAASRMPGWENTERFYLDKMLESFVVKNADKVATLTSALVDELVRRGADKRKAIVAPNAVDLEEFKPLERHAELGDSLGLKENNFVIGYAGSVVTYEGLDVLLDAFFALVAIQSSARILIVGGGDALPSLREQSISLGIEDKVIFTGRVDASEVRDYISLMNVIALPRKAFKVCQLVPPLKPFEAMAMKIPLLVSSVDALKEISQDGTTAYVFQAENKEDMTQVLMRMMKDPVALAQMAERAYQYVHENHTWSKVSKKISDAYSDE